MSAPPRRKGAGTANADPKLSRRETSPDAPSKYTESYPATTVTKFVRERVSRRRFASVRLKEIYTLALYRRREDFVVDGGAFASVLAFHLATDRPGRLYAPGDRGKPRLVPWTGLSLQTLRNAIESAELGDFGDEHLLTVIADVRAWREKHGTCLPTARKLGRDLQLTAIERDACSIRTFEAVDESKAEREARLHDAKLIRDREHKRASRGSIPREVYEAASLSRLKPWEAFGISRRQWERRGKPDVASVSPAIESQRAPDLRHEGNQTVADAARPGGARRYVGADGPSPRASTISLAASRDGGDTASDDEGFTEADLIPTVEEPGPGEPPVPLLTGRAARVVALAERARELPWPDTGLTASLGLGALAIRISNETSPEQVQEIAATIARELLSLLRPFAANDNRVGAIVRRLAA